MKIKKGDNVIVITGSNKGKKGKILRAIPASNQVVVEGVNLKKKTHKSNKKGDRSQILDIAMPIDASNVAKHE
ncbi:MAG TPA: 50S ribosomal protein L24 [Candidatus Paceibacterota bacterium]|nr:50S ribosomal protein L24 [Candidatus Paceibacterota bacterium]